MNGGHVMGDAIKITTICGQASTIIKAPEILPNSVGFTSHLMVYPENEYVL